MKKYTYTFYVSTKYREFDYEKDRVQETIDLSKETGFTTQELDKKTDGEIKVIVQKTYNKWLKSVLKTGWRKPPRKKRRK